MNAERERCAGTKDDGTPCQSPIVGPDGYCSAHAPGGRAEMQRRALKGAIKSRTRKGLDPDELPPLETHLDAKVWLEAIGRAVATGRLADRAAQAAVRAVEAWGKAHSEGSMAEEVEGIREQLKEFKRTSRMKVS